MHTARETDPHHIKTLSGRRFYYDAASQASHGDHLHIGDIAAGLAKECRFVGQCRGFYSVAQHLVLAHLVAIRRMSSDNVRKHALIHDGAEGFCKDIPRPLKSLLSDYKSIEGGVQAALVAKLGLPFLTEDEQRQLKRIDNELLATEQRDITAPWLDGTTRSSADSKAQPLDWLHICPGSWNEIDGAGCYRRRRCACSLGWATRGPVIVPMHPWEDSMTQWVSTMESEFGRKVMWGQ